MQSGEIMMGRTRLTSRAAGICLVSTLALFCVAACQKADTNKVPKTGVAAFYDGRNIKWIIPYSPGGGYDEYARLISPYLEKYTGARVDIYNMPGAGGLRGNNELFGAAKNGLTIGSINGSAMVTNELAEMRGADYKITEFEFLGRIVFDTRVFVVSLDSGYETFEQIWDAGEGVNIGATGLGGSTYVDAVVANEAFDLQLNIVHGFDSSSVLRQAMLRGDIIGSWGSWGSALDAVDQGRHKVVLQSGMERSDDLADVPTAFEMAEKTPDPEHTRAILAAWESLHRVGRPVAVPPGTPPERIQFLREAFAKALHDPDLIAKAEKSGRIIRYASGEEMTQLVETAMQMPDDIRQFFIGAVKGQL
jgi:tripartite-type tricarboxylate transporter receptor subunit TctC